jgi:hypothetical protein
VAYGTADGKDFRGHSAYCEHDGVPTIFTEMFWAWSFSMVKRTRLYLRCTQKTHNLQSSIPIPLQTMDIRSTMPRSWRVPMPGI